MAEQEAGRRRIPLWVPALLCLLVLMLDIGTPRGVAGGIAYVPLVFCGLWLARPQSAFVLAAVATLLTVLAFYAKAPSAVAAWMVATDRVLSVLAVWFTATLVFLRRRTEQALRESEVNKSAARTEAREKTALLASLVESSKDAIISRDLHGVVTSWNRGAELIFGYSAAEMIGKEVSRFIPEDGLHDEDAILAAIQRGDRAVHLETRRLHKDGSTVDISVSVSPIFGSEGKLIGASGIVRDITMRKRAEAGLLRKTEELQRSNRDLEQFAYVASHDLQEPLRAVSGCVQLLQKRYGDKLDERADELIGYAVDGTSRMQALIEALLTYSRVSRMENPLQPIDCAAALDLALKNLSAAIQETGSEVSRDPLPTVMGIPANLALLFQNLIGNAIKFRKKGEPAKVRVRAERRDGEWLISVADEGIGIEPQYFERIFTIFQRLHTRQEYPGTGIGLALCKRIVEHHGGCIEVESEPGKGSKFSFNLRAV
ncbi:MAG TPA: PAS domain S-box protein [Terracidiphilus sp.]|nr:PAS domain S-box protein [Terracidiphilus sp.]